MLKNQNKLIKPVQRFFNFKIFVWVLFAFLLLFNVKSILFSGHFGVDNTFQMIGGINFIKGHDVSIPYADFLDLSKTEYKKIISWPSGESILFGLVYYLTNNIYLSNILIFILALILYLVAWYRVYLLIKPNISNQKHLLLSFILFVTYVQYTFAFYFCIDPTDFICSTLLLLSLSFIFDRQRTHIRLILGIIILSLTYAFRFAYYPVVLFTLLIALYSLIKGKSKDKLSIGFLILGIIITAICFKTNVNIVSLEKTSLLNLQFSNIKKFNIAFPFQFLIDESIFPSFFKIIIGILFIIYYLYVSSKLYYFFNKKDCSSYYVFVTLALISVVTIFMLIYLSLRYKMQVFTDGKTLWTAVEEKRYYAPVFLFLTFLIFSSAFISANIVAQRISKYIIFISIVLSFILNFNFKTIYSFRIYPYYLILKGSELISVNNPKWGAKAKYISDRNNLSLSEYNMFMSRYQEIAIQKMEIEKFKFLKSLINTFTINQMKPIYLSDNYKEGLKAGLLGARFYNYDPQKKCKTSKPVFIIVSIYSHSSIKSQKLNNLSKNYSIIYSIKRFGATFTVLKVS
jgi:hypothetical protein